MIEETSHDQMRLCPYCGCGYYPEGGSQDGVVWEEQCDGCGKKYYARDEVSVTYNARPCCELNGEEHEPGVLGEDGKVLNFCKKCNEFLGRS